MKTWTPKLSGSSSFPRYKEILDALKKDIASGKLPAGTRLPSQRKLAKNLHVSIPTITRAFNEAKQLGIISGEVGRGSFIAHRFDSISNQMDLSINTPAILSCETDINVAIRSALERLNPKSGLGYPTAFEEDDIRNVAAEWLTGLGVATNADRLILTAGGHHGLFAVMLSQLNPGDVVLAEEFCYPGLIPISKSLDLQLVPVPMDAQGLVADELESLAAQNKAKALFCNPNIQNPTAATMSIERRKQLVEVAERHQLLIFEDDVSRGIVDNPPRSIAELAPERTFYITSLSKLIAPGFRVGYIICPFEFINSVQKAVHATHYASSPYTTSVATEILRSGLAERLIEAQKAEAALRYRVLKQYLNEYIVGADTASFHSWINLPFGWTPDRFIATSASYGIILPNTEIFIAGKERNNRHMRLALGGLENMSQVKKALSIISRLLISKPHIHSNVI